VQDEAKITLAHSRDLCKVIADSGLILNTGRLTLTLVRRTWIY
jgi:hypothetical protein